MALTNNILTEISYIAGITADALYDNDLNTTAYVQLIIIHNGNSTSENVKLYKVPNNSGSLGTAGVSNIMYNLTLVANETKMIQVAKMGIMLIAQHDSIQASTTTSNKVTVQIYGDKS